MTSNAQADSGVLMLDLEGTTLTSDEQRLLGNPEVGGIILFDRNYQEPDQLQALTDAIRDCNPELLIAVDQEGGRVQRLRKGFTRLPPMSSFGALWYADDRQAVAVAHECGWLMAAEVLASGLDFSFAPVLDLATGLSRVIGDRAFSDSPTAVVELASAFMTGMHEAGMATTGKHFPGHGTVEADSHVDLPVDERSEIEIRASDLLAFAGCLPVLDAVMPAHVIYPAVDTHCAGFSEIWIKRILRQELGFSGVVFSDDLSMAGAVAAGSMAQRIELALNAGCDMLLVCNDRPAALQAIAILEQREIPARSALSVMRRRKTWSRAELEGSDRYRQVRTQLDNLILS